MKLAWLTKLPTTGVPARGDGSSTLLTDVFPAKSAFELPKETKTPQKAPVETGAPLWNRCVQTIRDLLPFTAPKAPSKPQPFVIPEQKHWKEQIENYAESPFEKELFSLKKKAGGYTISKAWADGIKSSDPLTRDSAVALLRDYLTYAGIDNGNHQVSPHTQMKLLFFAPHLTEGILGKAVVYEALLSLPLPQLMEFAGALKKEFSLLPPTAQALIMKQMLEYRKALPKDENEEELEAFKKLLKSLVIAFYSSKHDSMAQVLQQQEKIRLGFLKIQPVEDAYRKQLEEIERKYRLKLRQLKKHRSQKVAQAEEEKLRRIELIYDAVEGSLMSGLNELNQDLDDVLTV